MPLKNCSFCCGSLRSFPPNSWLLIQSGVTALLPNPDKKDKSILKEGELKRKSLDITSSTPLSILSAIKSILSVDRESSSLASTNSKESSIISESF